MSLYVPEGTPPIVPNALARIERLLPYPGEVLVREGARVEPEDIVAKAFMPAPTHVVNVAQLLAIPPLLVEQVMLHEVGHKVAQGEELAQSGLNSCKAPVSGIIRAIDTETGYVTIAPDPIAYTMVSNIRGVVMEVFPYRGVSIETPASQVYGVFGIGEERSGILQLAVTDPDQMIEPEQIDARSAYTILIGGSGVGVEALRRALQFQVRGIIVGGIEERELRAFLGWESQDMWHVGTKTWSLPDSQTTPDPGLTLMITEGFGLRPMSKPIFELLSARDRQEALISGTTQLRRKMRRPRLVISLTRSADAQVELSRPQIRSGVLVRLLDMAHLGQVGRVRVVSSAPERVGGNVLADSVEIIQENGDSFWLPRTAVDVLE